MRIWNRALSTLLNPGGLEPEPGEISEFKDARKPKSNKAKPEPGRGFQESVPERAARGKGGGGFVVPSVASGERQTGSARRPARSSDRPSELSELPFPPPRYQGGQGYRAAAPERCPRAPTGRWRRARVRAQAATRTPGGAARRRGRAEEAARPPARPGPPRTRGPRPLRPRAGSPGPWCTCSARGASGARRPAPCPPAPTQPAGPARPGRRAPRRPRSLRRDAALGSPGRGRRGQGARGLPQRAAAPGGRPDGPAAAPRPARGPP